MSTSATPLTSQQIRDRVTAAAKQWRTNYMKFAKDYPDPGSGALNIQTAEKFTKSNIINDHIAAVDQAHLAGVPILKRLEENSQLEETYEAIEDGLDRLDESVSANQQIVKMFRKLAASDNALALDLNRMVSKTSKDALASYKKSLDGFEKLLTQSDIPGKIRMIDDAKNHIKHTDELTQSLKVAIELQKQLISYLTMKNMDLEIELKSGPRLPDLQEGDVEEIVIRDFMRDDLGIEAQDFPTRWSELDIILQAQEIAISQPLREKLTELEGLMKLAEDHREQAVKLLQKEQKQHNATKSLLIKCKSKEDDLTQQLEAVEDAERLTEEKLAIVTRDKESLDNRCHIQENDILLKDVELKRNQETIKGLKDTIQNMNQVMAKLNQDILDSKIATAAEAAGRGGDVAVWTEKYNNEVRNLKRCEETRKGHEIRTANLSDRVDVLQEENVRLNTQVAQVQAENQNHLARVKSLEADVDSKDAIILSRHQDILSLTANISAKGDDLRMKSNRIKALEDHKAKFEETMVAKEAECEAQKGVLQKQADETVQQEVDRSKDLENQRKEELAVIQNAHQDKLNEYNKQNTRLEWLIDGLEKTEADLTRKLAQQTQEYDSVKVSRDQKKEEVASLQQKLAVNQSELSNQSIVMEGLRQRVSGSIEVSKELNLAHGEIEKHKNDIEEVREEKIRLQKMFDDFQHIILRWGFGGANEQIDLSIVDKFRAPTSISSADLNKRCEDWNMAIVYQFAAERVTAVELWILSIAEPAKLSMTTIIGFVQSKPTPNQLPFLEVAIANVITHADKLDFQQAAFILRGIELLWMAAPAGRSESLRRLLWLVKQKLPASTFIAGLNTWLTVATEGEGQDTREGEIIRLARENILTLDGGVTLVMDDFLLLIQDGSITLVDKDRLRSPFDAKDDCWLVWIDGYLQAGIQIKTKFPFSVENLELLSRTIN